MHDLLHPSRMGCRVGLLQQTIIQHSTIGHNAEYLHLDVSSCTID